MCVFCFRAWQTLCETSRPVVGQPAAQMQNGNRQTERDSERDRDGGGGKYDMCNEVLIGAQIMPMSVSDSVAHAKCQSETFIAHTHFVAAAAAAYA